MTALATVVLASVLLAQIKAAEVQMRGAPAHADAAIGSGLRPVPAVRRAGAANGRCALLIADALPREEERGGAGGRELRARAPCHQRHPLKSAYELSVISIASLS